MEFILGDRKASVGGSGFRAWVRVKQSSTVSKFGGVGVVVSCFGLTPWG